MISKSLTSFRNLSIGDKLHRITVSLLIGFTGKTLYIFLVYQVGQFGYIYYKIKQYAKHNPPPFKTKKQLEKEVKS